VIYKCGGRAPVESLVTLALFVIGPPTFDLGRRFIDRFYLNQV
jgi:hypothetical protein